MRLIDVAADIFIKKLAGTGESLQSGEVADALQKLLPTQGGELDLQALLEQFLGRGGGLSTLVTSWLGDTGNAPLSGAQVLEVFGQEKVSNFASRLGLDTVTAATGLSDTLPDLIDKTSEAGRLLDHAQLKRGHKLFGSLF